VLRGERREQGATPNRRTLETNITLLGKCLE
jgi:hypothetical protein